MRELIGITTALLKHKNRGCVKPRSARIIRIPMVIQMYTSLVRPHVEYAAPLWDPYLIHDIHSIVSVQKFALRVCFKRWDYGYPELLVAFNLPSLENRQTYLKLYHLYNILHDPCYIPENTVYPRTNSVTLLQTSHTPSTFCSHQLLILLYSRCHPKMEPPP